MNLLSQDCDKTQIPIPLNIGASVILVTVPMAKNWLSNMIENQRKPSLPTVNKYASEMKAGRWELSAPLSFDTEGRLIDGQHRLMAVIKSEIPTNFLIVGNLPTSAAIKFDLGKARTAQNIAHLKGYEWMKRGHISTYVAMFENPSISTNIPTFAHEEKINGIIDHQEAIEFATSRVCGIWQNSCFVSVVARAYYSQNHQRLEEFLEVLITGVCKVEGDSAAIALRDFWIKNYKKYRSGRDSRLMLVRLTTSALRRFVRREKTKSLKETTVNHFPVKHFDDWWQSKSQSAA